jgi:hypothetical protein
MTKRATRANAETLESVRRQSETRGRKLGRQDLAFELAETMDVFEAKRCLFDLACWLKGYAAGKQGDPGPEVSCGLDALGMVEHTLAKIAEETRTTAL